MRGRRYRVYTVILTYCFRALGRMGSEAIMTETHFRYSEPRGDSLRLLKNARKTATAPVLMPCAWVRARSIERLGRSRAVNEAATAPGRCAASLGPGTILKKSVQGPIGRLSGTAVAGCTRCGQQLGAHS